MAKLEKAETRVQPAPPVLSGGQPLPETIRHQMETSFGADFSSVRVHHGQEATLLGASAFTRGEHIHFAPGQYDPHSSTGQEMLGHELTHVVQQRAGRVGLAPGLIQS
ncbi:MAG TPA: DUF4157 domain-containing protein [Bryobacteraceae bacterium]|nr:DUF4157 domain-containing protein [Bryobacteraceae bacterium]